MPNKQVYTLRYLLEGRQGMLKYSFVSSASFEQALKSCLIKLHRQHPSDKIEIKNFAAEVGDTVPDDTTDPADNRTSEIDHKLLPDNSISLFIKADNKVYAKGALLGPTVEQTKKRMSGLHSQAIITIENNQIKHEAEENHE